MSKTTLTMKVELTLRPKAGQTMPEAIEEMRDLFTDYITGEGNLRDDYGASDEEIDDFHSGKTPSPVWGGWEGPFITDATAEEVEA